MPRYSKKSFTQELKRKFKDHIIIGVTGHRDLLPDNEAQITKAISEKLKAIQAEAVDKPVLVLSAYAVGADQWVAKCAKDISDITVGLVLPMPQELYIKYNFVKAIERDQEGNSTTIIYDEISKQNFLTIATDTDAIVIDLFEKVPNELTLAQRDKQYQELARFLAEHSHHLIALWDGVNTGAVGGTADVVWMTIHSKSQTNIKISPTIPFQHVHQLVVPRVKNLFPTGRRFSKNQIDLPPGAIFEWVQSDVQHPKKLNILHQIYLHIFDNISWYLVGFILVIGLLLINLLNHGFNWIQDSIIIGSLVLCYLLAAIAYQRWRTAREVLLRFAYPLIIAMLVLILGTKGYKETKLTNFGDQFFAAANLITLNSSIFGEASVYEAGGTSKAEQVPSKKPIEQITGTSEKIIGVPIFLELARILGGFLAGYAFILAFSLAAGKENIIRIRFWLLRNFSLRSFTIVIGNDNMAIDLAVDLTDNHKKKVILLVENLDDKYLPIIEQHSIWLLHGNITSRQSLHKTYFRLAEEIYIVSGSDEENFRCAQEMDDMAATQVIGWPVEVKLWLKSYEGSNVFKKIDSFNEKLINSVLELFQLQKRDSEKEPQWYVHLHSLRQKSLLQSITRKHINTFNIDENTARRLLLRYPVDRFNLNNSYSQAKIAQVIVLGFSRLGQEITLTSLRSGHYGLDYCVQVKVYYLAEEKESVNQFKNNHPELFTNIKSEEESASYNNLIKEYTFYRNRSILIDFEMLPSAESLLIDYSFSLYKYINPVYSVTLYVCLPTGLESASLLASILPRIEWLKINYADSSLQTDVQVFCFYNFPDPDEETFVEMKLNSLAPHIPVICFGNFIHECAASAIRNESLNRVAKQIGLLYACLGMDEDLLGKLPDLAKVLSELNFNKKYNRSELSTINIIRAQQFLSVCNKISKVQFERWLATCWENMNEIDREANRQAADHIWIKLRIMRKKWWTLWEDTTLDLTSYWTQTELEQLGEVEHRRWNAEKLMAGWLPFEDFHIWKNNKAAIRTQKHHHFLMTFDQLPNDEKNKDHTQIAGIPYFITNLKF